MPRALGQDETRTINGRPCAMAVRACGRDAGRARTPLGAPRCAGAPPLSCFKGLLDPQVRGEGPIVCDAGHQCDPCDMPCNLYAARMTARRCIVHRGIRIRHTHLCTHTHTHAHTHTHTHTHTRKRSRTRAQTFMRTYLPHAHHVECPMPACVQCQYASDEGGHDVAP